MSQELEFKISKRRAVIQLTLFSMIGIFSFFVPITYHGKKSILFDHLASFLTNELRTLAIVLLFMMMIYGAFKPFVKGDWNKSVSSLLLSAAKMLGLIIAILYITGLAPDIVMQKDMMPFIFNKLALPVGMIIPIGALILASLIGFGLLEMIGVLMQPIMKPIWKTPGSSAIDAVASFVGSYSIGLLITNRVYLENKYSTKEAVIIATGFSTVSAAFMVIVAKTLDLMSFWNTFFWSTLIITFIVTAITARIPPISQEKDTDVSRKSIHGRHLNRFKAALEVGIEVSRRNNAPFKTFVTNFRDGIEMSAAVVPSIIAVGLLGLLLDKYTPVFDILGLLIYPFTWALGLPEPLEAAKGISSGLAEMFLPALILADSDTLTRYVAGVTSISSIIFFSALIPCVLATKIPLSVTKLLVIWYERTALSIIFAAAFGYFALTKGLIS